MYSLRSQTPCVYEQQCVDFLGDDAISNPRDGTITTSSNGKVYGSCRYLYGRVLASLTVKYHSELQAYQCSKVLRPYHQFFNEYLLVHPTQELTDHTKRIKLGYLTVEEFFKLKQWDYLITDIRKNKTITKTIFDLKQTQPVLPFKFKVVLRYRRGVMVCEIQGAKKK
jgi:hypothetical protein